MSSQELQFSSLRNCEKFAYEGCLIAFDKFSADNTKNFGGVIGVMMAVRRESTPTPRQILTYISFSFSFFLDNLNGKQRLDALMTL